ncbi:MAG: ATP-binding cassette domain-containing protein [Candidatus Latescibacteria bacterium]|nr:ATP-binding cassette domain-containing protein [Candidatus Latescibacterota bacterium]
MIDVRNLAYEYPEIRALDDISLQLQTGSITALVGPNGAGKSTLLRCLATLGKPFSGTITIDGIDAIADPVPCRKLLGYLPDFFGLYEDLTVAQTLTYFARAYRLDPATIDERVREVAGKVDLADKVDHPNSSLSRGMRQRLAIGQAIIHQPRLLLLDEPASGLDPEARHALAGLFLELRDQGITILVSSHILAELDAYADDLIALRKGKLLTNFDRQPRRKLHFSLLEPHPQLEQLLSADAGVTAFRLDGLQAELDFAGDENQQAALLKALLDSGAAISAFYAATENLQDQYMDLLDVEETQP